LKLEGLQIRNQSEDLPVIVESMLSGIKAILLSNNGSVSFIGVNSGK
jgi:hypothetical protein